MKKDSSAKYIVKEDVEDEPVEYFCGFGRCRPKCLQVFRNAKFFTFLLCCFTFIEGTLATGFVSGVLSTLEQRYQLTSLQTGLLVSVFDMAVLVSVVFISYSAGRGHKPRWLGAGLLLMGLGSLIFALPQFVFGEYRASNVETFQSCSDVNSTFANNCEVTETNRLSLIFFIIGNIIIGVGAAGLYTVGPSYVDDIVRPKYVSIHLGIFLAFTIFAPGVGFGVAAGFLTIYVDFWRETDLVPSNPAYVGAWWLCFLFSTVLCWLVAIPFLMFPKLLPDSHLVKAEREEEMARRVKWAKTEDALADNATLLAKIVSFPRHLLDVVTTPSWVFITIAIGFSAFVVTGVTSFAPKLYESQFSLTPTLASFTAGAIGIPTGTVGVFVGGLIIFCTKSSGRRAAMINWIVTLIAIPPLLVFLARCPSVQLAGVNVPFSDGYVVSERYGPAITTCNLNCNCSSPIYEPICGSDNITYFSPCIAGCEKTFRDDETPVFENCSCIEANRDVMSNFTLDAEELAEVATAEVGECPNGCVSLGIFLGISAIALFVLFTLQVPNFVVTLRCVSEQQRSLAVGLQSAIFRLFGNVPGPIVFGYMFDSACIYFRLDLPCKLLGNCWVYDNFQLSWSILAAVLIAIGSNFIFSFLAWVFYPKKDVSGAETAVNDIGALPLTDKTDFREEVLPESEKEGAIGSVAVL